MGCGISKTALEEIESSVDVKAVPQRSIASDKGGKEEETIYLANNGPKCVSSPSERGFLKWVYVSNDRDKEVDREIRSYDNGQKIVCSSALIAQQLRTRVSEDQAAITKRVDPKTFIEKEILVERLGEEGVGEDKDDNLIREDSLIASPASPSFRVYCVLRGSMSSHDEGGQENACPLLINVHAISI
ncbi:hypothetical protein K2173_000716 [Erythroxylum novogranatense]|uniref:Uncharacterized protein n=1 Tax=Erythroxylum novogranatense TaxID=1862640 RepID=A0AAV8SIV9_9ROSI|nr:hypothetical protein K2173_000716 [Erythroxylum novogranatense]